jgi:hypothetical protein
VRVESPSFSERTLLPENTVLAEAFFASAKQLSFRLCPILLPFPRDGAQKKSLIKIPAHKMYPKMLLRESSVPAIQPIIYSWMP